MPSSLRQLTESLAGYRPDALRVELARDAINRAITPITEIDRVPLKQALGRVLAADLVSPINVPARASVSASVPATPASTATITLNRSGRLMNCVSGRVPAR